MGSRPDSSSQRKEVAGQTKAEVVFPIVTCPITHMLIKYAYVQARIPSALVLYFIIDCCYSNLLV